jgi:hypothetical protein
MNFLCYRFCSNLPKPRSDKVTKGSPDKPPLGELDLEVEHFSLKTDSRRNSTKNKGTDNSETRDISNTNLVADEEAGLFHDQLQLRLKDEKKKKKVEIVENLQNDFETLSQEEESLQSQLLREHKQLLRDENEMFEKMKEPKVSSESQNSSRPASTLPTVNLYDISSRPVSAVNFRYANNSELYNSAFILI